MFPTGRFYLFLRRDPPHRNGHNPLAALSYIGLYIRFILSILTGLGLFAWVIRTPPYQPRSAQALHARLLSCATRSTWRSSHTTPLAWFSRRLACAVLAGR